MCTLSQSEQETTDHLFVQGKNLQSKCGLKDAKMHMTDVGDTWKQHLQWLIKSAKGKSQEAQIYRMVQFMP